MPGPWAGSATDKRPARGRSPRVPVTRFELPAPVPLAGNGLESRSQETEMDNSPYLDKPIVPLAFALRSMLMETEAKIATAALPEKARLQQRAEVLREWLTPRPARSVAV
jgi:hypothetical protein